jgi:hypothetical protein
MTRAPGGAGHEGRGRPPLTIDQARDVVAYTVRYGTEGSGCSDDEVTEAWALVQGERDREHEGAAR